MNQKYLKNVRLALGVLVLALFVAYFLIPNSQQWPLLHELGHLQLVPAIMLVGFSVAPLVVLLLLSLLLGRAYCSVLCPLGLLQDAAHRCSRIFRVKKKRKFTYSKPNTVARYSLLAAAILAWVLGFSALVSLLDPYGAFGRIAANLMRPLYYAANNLLAWVLNHFNVYSVYNVTLHTVSVLAAAVAGATLLVVAVAAALRGRWYCNTICPVGTGLGLLSKLSIFQLKIDETACNSCGICAARCKAECIESKAKRIDQTRCVACYTCLAACSKDALKLRFAYGRKEAAVDQGKRRSMVAGVAALAAIPASAAAQALDKPLTASSDEPVVPPGAKSLKHFKSRCTACHLCVSKCPAQVIKPSFLELGLAGMLQPVMDYRISFCTYDCTVCSQVCPNGALEPLSPDAKRDLQIGKAHFDRNICVVYTDETDCGACSEHCPTQAVHMVPYKDGLRIPEVDASICVGCGGCQYICPVRPRTAIFVQGNATQQPLNMQHNEKQEEVKVDDFGF